MTDIKLYKELIAIETFWWVLYTPAKIEDLDAMVETKKFITVWDQRIAVHQIKNYYLKKLDTVESFILSQPKDIQKKIQARSEQMYERVGRKFENIEQVQKYIDSIENKE